MDTSVSIPAAQPTPESVEAAPSVQLEALAANVRKLQDRIANLENARACEAVILSRTCTRVSSRAIAMMQAAYTQSKCKKAKTH